MCTPAHLQQVIYFFIFTFFKLKCVLLKIYIVRDMTSEKHVYDVHTKYHLIPTKY